MYLRIAWWKQRVLSCGRRRHLVGIRHVNPPYRRIFFHRNKTGNKSAIYRNKRVEIKYRWLGWSSLPVKEVKKNNKHERPADKGARASISTRVYYWSAGFQPSSPSSLHPIMPSKHRRRSTIDDCSLGRVWPIHSAPRGPPPFHM